MKKRILKTAMALLAVFSLFLLFSCGKGDDDKLKADAFEQFNESIKDVAGVFSGEIDNAPEIELDSLLNYDFSLDNIYVDEFLGYEIDSITVKDGIMFLQGLDAPGLVTPKNFAAKIYDGEMVLFELLGSSVRETVVPIDVEMPEFDTESINGIGDIFDALLIDKDDLKETVTEGKFKLKDGYLEKLAKSLDSFGLKELIEAIEITVDTSEYDSKKKIVFTFLVGNEEMRMTVGFDKADGVDTVTILLDEENSDESTELTLKTKDGKFVGFAIDAGDSEEYMTLKFGLEAQKSDVKGLEKQSLSLKLLTVGSESEVNIEASGDVYQNKGGAIAKLDIDVRVKEEEKTLLSASLLYDESCLKKEGKEGVSISLMLRDIDLDDIKGGITEISAKPLGNKGEYYAELSLKTEKYTDTEKSYKLSLEFADEDGEKSGGAWINFPAKTVPELTEEERYAIENRNQIIENNAFIETINRKALLAIESGKFNPAQYYFKVYTKHEGTGIHYFTDITRENGKYYVDTRVISDYESVLPLYAKNVYDFIVVRQSEAALEVNEICANVDIEFKDKYYHEEKRFAPYIYLEKYGCYAFAQNLQMIGGVWMTDEPTSEMFPDLVLHEIKKSENGYILHEYEFEKEEWCVSTYKCGHCGTRAKLKKPAHQYSEAERKVDTGAEQFKLYSCTKCSDKYLDFCDEHGSQIRLLLTDLKYVDISYVLDDPGMENYQISDPDRCLFASEIDAIVLSKNTEAVIIPRIDLVYGYKIIGIDSKFCAGQPFNHTKIILPEGVEILMGNAFDPNEDNDESFSEIILPDSLVYIAEGAFTNCTVRELIIPRNVRYMGRTAMTGNDSLIKVVVNAENLEYFPIIYAKNLEELILNAAPKTFCLFASDKITEFEIPEGVEIFERDTSYYGLCRNLKKLVFPTTLTRLEDEPPHIESITFKGEYKFHISGVCAYEINYLGPITSVIAFGKVTNIYTTELPEAADGVTYKVPSTVEEINFAGTELEFIAAGYVLESPTTVVNYDVTFEKKEE